MNIKFKTLKKFLSHDSGATLMEFAVVTTLMAVLAATAAPRFSVISEGGKFRKSQDEIQKIAKQAVNFFQDMAVKEGRGRFPGQVRFDSKVGGHNTLEDLHLDLFGVTEEITNDDGAISTIFTPPTFTKFDGLDGSDWVSIFGTQNLNEALSRSLDLNSDYPEVSEIWSGLFGDEMLESPFQDGHYVFQVFPGSGSGSQSDSPTLFIADIENPSQINIVVKP